MPVRFASDAASPTCQVKGDVAPRDGRAVQDGLAVEADQVGLEAQRLDRLGMAVGQALHGVEQFGVGFAQALARSSSARSARRSFGS